MILPVCSLKVCYTDYSLSRRRFCSARPRFSIAVYSYHRTLQGLKLRAASPSFPDRIAGLSSGDFDSDGVADVVVMTSKAVAFYLSASRKKGSVSLDSVDYQLQLPESCQGAVMRVADFDLDGLQEILVLCRYGGIKMFRRTPAIESGGQYGWRIAPDVDASWSSPLVVLGRFCEGVPVYQYCSNGAWVGGSKVGLRAAARTL